MQTHKKLLTTVGVLLLLIGCGGGAGDVTEIEPTAAPPPTAEPSPTPRPSRTPTPPPTATDRPTSTPLPTATSTPQPTATLETADELDGSAAAPYPLIWLPFGFGSYGDPLLAIEDGEVVELAEPADPAIEAFFDFHPSGRIIYGSTFWAAAANDIDSVTDLWEAVLINGEEGEHRWETRQLRADNVGRAAYQPALDDGDAPGFPLALARHNGISFDLVLLDENQDETVVAQDVEPNFSWSPDGRQLAYVQANQLAVYDVEAAESRLLNANVRGGDGGWVGDAPLWDLERQLLLYPAEPVLIVPLPGSDLPQREPYVPLLLDDEPLYDLRPFQMLWSAELDQLIVQEEEQINAIHIYLFTSDLAYLQDDYYLENATLLGWREVGRSIVILDENNEPAVWDLLDYEFTLEN